MNECLSSHRSCSAQTSAQDDNTRPARLLDMSGCCRSGIRLIETKSGTSYQYACLSHRWDNAVADHKTTTENLPSRLSSLALRKLPVNFRDAVSIARGLNIKCLWIDSICIIQDGDNGADLNRELAKMGFIYQNAHLTIVAVSSSDSSGGCFPRPASDVCFSVPNNTQDDYLIGARVLDKKGHAVSIDDINAHYPLLTRGWVFQEVLLSPRICPMQLRGVYIRMSRLFTLRMQLIHCTASNEGTDVYVVRPSRFCRPTTSEAFNRCSPAGCLRRL